MMVSYAVVWKVSCLFAARASAFSLVVHPFLHTCLFWKLWCGHAPFCISSVCWAGWPFPDAGPFPRFARPYPLFTFLFLRAFTLGSRESSIISSSSTVSSLFSPMYTSTEVCPFWKTTGPSYETKSSSVAAFSFGGIDVFRFPMAIACACSLNTRAVAKPSDSKTVLLALSNHIGDVVSKREAAAKVSFVDCLDSHILNLLGLTFL